MAVTYGTTALPSPVVTVREQTSTAVSLAFDRAVGIVGGYDSANGSLDNSNENTNIEVEDIEFARSTFGEGSELARQTRLAFANGAGRVVCTPVGETETTESFTGVSTFTVDGDIVDPRFNPEETIEVQDTVDTVSCTVNLVDGTPTTPTEANTVNINPQTGEAEADASADYDVTYTEGDYTSAVTEAAKADVRFSAVCHAKPAIHTDHLAAINDQATAIDFKRGVGAVPTAVDPSSYDVPLDDQRYVLTAPTDGTFDGGRVFLSVPIAAQMASEELGSSATGNGLSGIESIGQDFSISEITDFGDKDDIVDQVTVVNDGLEGLEVAEDLTTSSGSKFRDVYRCEIIDDIAYSVHLASKGFINSNSPNTPQSRSVGLESPVRRVLRGAANNTPPLLSSTDGSNPFAVSSSAGDNDEEVDLEIGIDVTGLTKTVDVTLGVGSVQTFEGAS